MDKYNLETINRIEKYFQEQVLFTNFEICSLRDFINGKMSQKQIYYEITNFDGSRYRPVYLSLPVFNVEEFKRKIQALDQPIDLDNDNRMISYLNVQQMFKIANDVFNEGINEIIDELEGY